MFKAYFYLSMELVRDVIRGLEEVRKLYIAFVCFAIGIRCRCVWLNYPRIWGLLSAYGYLSNAGFIEPHQNCVELCFPR